MRSVGLSRSRWRATVSSTTPSELPRWPPVLATVSMIAVRISAQSWTSSTSLRRLRSAGPEIVARIDNAADSLVFDSIDPETDSGPALLRCGSEVYPEGPRAARATYSPTDDRPTIRAFAGSRPAPGGLRCGMTVTGASEAKEHGPPPNA